MGELEACETRPGEFWEVPFFIERDSVPLGACSSVGRHGRLRGETDGFSDPRRGPWDVAVGAVGGVGAVHVDSERGGGRQIFEI